MGLRWSATRAFDDLDPIVEWKQAGDDRDVVEIYLPGFNKEQVRVQVDDYGVLSAAGERPARGGRWVRFRKDFRLPDNCDVDGVRAEFVEKLVITLPIVATEASPAPAPLSESETPPPSPTTYYEPPPPPPRRPLPPPRPHPPTYEPPPRLHPQPPPVPPPPPPPPPYHESPPPPAVRPSTPPEPSRYPEPPPSPSPQPEPPRRPTYYELPVSLPSPSPPPQRPDPVTPTVEPKTPQYPSGTPATVPEPKVPALLERKISISPPSPLPSPPRHAADHEAPEKQLNNSKAPEEVGTRVSWPSPEEEERREETGVQVRGKVDETMEEGETLTKKNQQQTEDLPSRESEASTTTMAPEPARQLLLNIAAAVASLLGIITTVWRTLWS